MEALQRPEDYGLCLVGRARAPVEVDERAAARDAGEVRVDECAGEAEDCGAELDEVVEGADYGLA